MITLMTLMLSLQDSKQTVEIQAPVVAPQFGLVRLSRSGKSVAVISRMPRRVQEEVPYQYSVTVMVTVTDKDGNKKQVPRQELRQGVRTVTRLLHGPPRKLYDLSRCRFRTPDGKQLADKGIEARIRAKSVPAVLLTKGAKLDPFFKSVLKETTIIVELPPDAPAKGKPGAKKKPANTK